MVPSLYDYSSNLLTGPDCRQDIHRSSFAELLTKYIIEIPLIQREYCWGKGLAKTWWRDSRLGSSHSVGKIIFTIQDERDRKVLVCIDGQQRITTTFLFLTAARDIAIQLYQQCAAPFLQTLIDFVNSLLFTSASALSSYLSRTSSSNENLEDLSIKLDFIRLSPSYGDRPAFYDILLSGACGRTIATSSQSSNQFAVYSFFHDAFAKLLLNQESTTEVFSILEWRVHQVIEMQLMAVIPLNEINLGQVFLWFQEKSLIGVGALLYNPTPGIDFRPNVLIRNQLFTPFLNESLPQQEKLIREEWIETIERRFPSTSEFDRFLEQYAMNKVIKHESKMENTVKEIMMSKFGSDKQKGLLIYSKYVSMFEEATANSSSPGEKVIEMLRNIQSEVTKYLKGDGVEIVV